MTLVVMLGEAISDITKYLNTNPRHREEVETVLNYLKTAKLDIESNQKDTESINWIIWFAPRYIYDGFGHELTLDHIEKIRGELQKN